MRWAPSLSSPNTSLRAVLTPQSTHLPRSWDSLYLSGTESTSLPLLPPTLVMTASTLDTLLKLTSPTSALSARSCRTTFCTALLMNFQSSTMSAEVSSTRTYLVARALTKSTLATVFLSMSRGREELMVAQSWLELITSRTERALQRTACLLGPGGRLALWQ